MILHAASINGSGNLVTVSWGDINPHEDGIP